MKYSMVGIYIFFLLSTLRGNVEANWTAPVMVPLIVLSHQFLLEKLNWQKWLLRLLPATMVLVLFARVFMLVDILPLKAIRSTYHAWKQWPAEMKERTNGSLIVFNNSYQRASKYWFYSGQMTYSQNWLRERKNNFNYWPVEDSMLGKPVHILDIYDMDRYTDSIKTPIGWIGYRFEPKFNSFAKVIIKPSVSSIKIRQGERFLLNCKTSLPQHYYDFMSSNEILAETRIGVFGKKGWIKDLPVHYTLREMINRNVDIEIDPQLPAGKYFLRFGIQAPGGMQTHNSEKIKLVVE